MKRAMNPDGTPWWVSTGPPSRPAEAQPQPEQIQPERPTIEQPTIEQQTGDAAKDETSEGFFAIPLEIQAGAINSALNLAAAIATVLSRPLSAEVTSTPQPHSIDTCGTCPLCVAVSALKQHDARLGGVVESAMAGVTGSAEKLAGMLPAAIDSITEVAVSAVVRNLLHPRS